MPGTIFIGILLALLAFVIWVLRGNYGWISYTWRARLAKVYDVFTVLLPEKYFPYPFAGGKIYLNIKESIVILEQALGINEMDKSRVIKAFLKPGMVFVDIGANMGYFSLMAAQIAGEEGTVLAIEPEPHNCSLISRSIKASKRGNIHLHPIALGNVDTTVTLFVSPLSTQHTLVPDRLRTTRETITVSQKTLDSLLAESGVSHVDMLKIDVEGAEIAVLKGARKTLETNPNLLILLDIHEGVDRESLAGMLEASGFSLCDMRPPYHKLEILKDVKECLVWHKRA